MLSSSLFIVFLLARTVISRPHYSPILTVMMKEIASRSFNECTSTCNIYTAAKNACQGPNCGCNERYLKAQGDCLACQAGSAQDAASVQFTLDSETEKCREDGIQISGYKLQLPADAQAIVETSYRQGAALRLQQKVFLSLQIAGGHIGLVLVLITAIFRNARHDLTYLNFCITWIFSSIIYSIFLYRGTKGNTYVNSLGFLSFEACALQASFINGAQVMTACSTTALVVQFWAMLRTAIHGDLASPREQKKWVTLRAVLLASPYIFLVIFASTSFVLGKKRRMVQGVSLRQTIPGNFFCTIIGNNHFAQAMYGMTFGFLIIATFFDALIIFTLYRHWRTFRNSKKNNAVSLPILVRVVIFSAYRVAVEIAYGSTLKTPPEIVRIDPKVSVTFSVAVWVDMLQAATPLVAFLVFGANTTVVSLLCFWRGHERTVSSAEGSNVLTTNMTDIHNTGCSDVEDEASVA